jgi:rhomboid protease GluP
MPSKKEEFSFPGLTRHQLLEFAYGTFLELGWTPKYAGSTTIAAYTPRSWNKNEIVVEAGDGILIVQSSLVNNESFDLKGRTQKHLNEFIAEFQKVKLDEPTPRWAEEIEKLREQTAIAVAEESKHAAEIDKVMKFSKGNLFITYSLIAINVVVFLLMVISGVNPTTPTAYDVLNWGGNFLPLTVSGDWWRLISCVFVHIGIIHLLFNMYALYMAGVYLEPMLGKLKFISAYICTGIIASVASLIWHDQPVPSAGASGAIFGMYGVFLALLLTKLIPKKIRIALLQNIGVFVVFNIVYGTQSSGIDNAAHIGGLISGMIIGFVYYFSLKKEEGRKNIFLPIAIMLITIAFAWFYIDSNKSSVTFEERENIQKEIKKHSGKQAE